MLSIFKKQRVFFSAEEQAQMVEAIRQAEQATSGEIRVYVESRNAMVEPLDRAREIFFELRMQQTKDRNAVLLYLAMDDHELALFADEGIYQRTGADYWNHAVRKMIADFEKDNMVSGICGCIAKIGAALQQEFPYNSATDKNELPDEIVFGK